jgi:hypothetical protein
MDSNLSTSGAANQLCATSPVVGVRSDCYVDPAPVTDVMFEQLRYLLTHKSPDCPPDCADCTRLHGAESWLLLPFRLTATQGSALPL